MSDIFTTKACEGLPVVCNYLNLKPIFPPATLGLEKGRYGVVTLHRPSNVDDASQLGVIVAKLVEIAGKLLLVFPVHPRARQ